MNYSVLRDKEEFVSVSPVRHTVQRLPRVVFELLPPLKLVDHHAHYYDHITGMSKDSIAYEGNVPQADDELLELWKAILDLFLQKNKRL